MDDVRLPITPKPNRFVDQFRLTIRRQGLSYATEKTYVHWVLRFIRHFGKRHPAEMGATEVSQFLEHLAVKRQCAPNTQRIVLNALVFLYERHLGQTLGELDFQYARKKRRMPTVFSHGEAVAVINNLSGVHQLIASLMYGSGLRVSEALNVRLKDLDFAQQQLTVRDGKGSNERFTLLPGSLYEALQVQMDSVRRMHRYDTENGFGSVFLPYALEQKYTSAAYETEWQFLFPAERISVDPRSGIQRRHHLHLTTVQRAVHKAIRKTGIGRRASSHTFRHSFATRLIETGYDIKLVQSLLGHRDIRTTEIYLHVVKNRGGAIKSSLDT